MQLDEVAFRQLAVQLRQEAQAHYLLDTALDRERGRVKVDMAERLERLLPESTR